MGLGDVLWQPSRDRVTRSQMWRFMVQMSERHGFDADWPSLHRWSVQHSGVFWQAMLDFAQIVPMRGADAVTIGQGMTDTQWFPGLQLNYAAHLLRHDGQAVAIDAEDERGRMRTLTRQQLRVQVARCAAALRAAGVVKGDRVAGFLPNIPEAVIAMAATASLGAVWSSCSPDFGVDGVLDRFGQITPKVLFATDGYSYNGKRIDCLERVRSIVGEIASIERAVVIPFLDDDPDIGATPRTEIFEDFLGGRATAAKPPELKFEPVPFDHPLFIMYSSGTTGVPKCIVHGHGGTLLQHMKELMLHVDLRVEDTIFYFTTCGWMMWNWVVSALGVGATLVLYEGSPGLPSLNRLFSMAERTGMTVFGTSPKFLSTCEKASLKPGKEHDLSRLRCMLSTGSPLTVENFEWVYNNVSADLQLSSICGGTDIISCFMLGNPILPVRAGEIQCLGLGMDVHALNEAGESSVGTKGELVCKTPFPSQPVGFWNDRNDHKYHDAYFSHYPGIWRHGDFIEITDSGGVVVYGRSDATLNPGGVRIGTAEIYRAVETLDEVLDSIVVGKNAEDGDVEVCLFAVLADGQSLDDDLVSRIKRTIMEAATRRHIPKTIRQVSAIPYTISGKKVELAVSQIIHGKEVKNRDALANPESLDQYRGLV